MTAAFEGLLFDGRSAAATPVRVIVAEGNLSVATLDGAPLAAAPLRGLSVTEHFASAPRQIELPGGAVVEIRDGAGLTAALAAAGLRPGLVERLQQRWPAAALACVASAALLALGFVYGVPAVTRLLAAAMPARTEARLGTSALELLDARLLGASTLTAEERRQAEDRIAEAARLAAPQVRYRLLFRSTELRPGVNAFALPGGTLVVLDELVRRTAGDDRLVAVFGHELGHAARRHATRALLQGAGVGAAASIVWGDFSGQAAAVPALLAMLTYSRDAEREADDDAVRFLRAAGRSPQAMLDALCLLARVQAEAGADGLPALLSSHPGIEERLARVAAAAGAAAPACPSAAARPPAPR